MQLYIYSFILFKLSDSRQSGLNISYTIKNLRVTQISQRGLNEQKTSPFCEFTLLSDHFIVHFFCTKNCFFLLWTLKMMHVFFRGLSVNFLIAILKRFLDILSIFSDYL